METMMTNTMKRKRARTGRRFDKLVTFYTAQLDSPDETMHREAAAHLKEILMHVEMMAERRATRIARAKEVRQEQPLPTDPDALAATIERLKAQVTGGAQ